MSLAEVEKPALALSENERARPAASLLETLSPEAEISDEEVLQQDADLDSGRTEEISHEEFVRRVFSDALAVVAGRPVESIAAARPMRAIRRWCCAGVFCRWLMRSAAKSGA